MNLTHCFEKTYSKAVFNFYHSLNT